MSLALSAYRNLWRSAKIAFQGDVSILVAAQNQIRNEFRQKAALDPMDASIPVAIQHAEEVAKVLRENVVQGKKTEGRDTYKLRIHKHIERGDNESIKTAGKGTVQGGCGCR